MQIWRSHILKQQIVLLNIGERGVLGQNTCMVGEVWLIQGEEVVVVEWDLTGIPCLHVDVVVTIYQKKKKKDVVVTVGNLRGVNGKQKIEVGFEHESTISLQMIFVPTQLNLLMSSRQITFRITLSMDSTSNNLRKS